jgi:hypothetical protein
MQPLSGLDAPGHWSADEFDAWVELGLVVFTGVVFGACETAVWVAGAALSIVVLLVVFVGANVCPALLVRWLLAAVLLVFVLAGVGTGFAAL